MKLFNLVSAPVLEWEQRTKDLKRRCVVVILKVAELKKKRNTSHGTI